ncbi:hypothetical protein [Bacillus sp. OK048]|uniref:hypothetical protein n=1 Tax=Bacillus sp. OK048 TaxID=1882761 RepID=UPI00088C1316|nr:hypothetical protein [Bacillus sp. OK048]SDM42126.1 hypothetical protein SAMN05443253_103252 [Bacillus sp. OK048]
MGMVQVYLDDELNDNLEKVSDELNVSKTVIGAITIYSLLSYYEAKSSFALLDIDCRITRGNEKKLKIDVPDNLKGLLKKMANEQARSMNQLVVGALRSFIKEYNKFGYRVFANLVAPKDQIISFTSSKTRKSFL